MKSIHLGNLAAIVSLVAAYGCGSARDVKVSGTIAGDTSKASGPIRLSFYQASSSADAGAAAAAELKLVDSSTVEAIGHFDRTVSMEGDELYVVAVVDADQNDACNDGESWGKAVTRVAP